MEELLKELRELYPALNERQAQVAAEVKKHGEASAEFKASLDEINDRIGTVEVAIQEKAAALRAATDSKDDVDFERKLRDFGRVAGRPVSADEYKAHSEAIHEYVAKKGETHRMSPDHVKNLVEDVTGELIVPFDLVAGVYRQLPQLNVMYQLCSVRTTTRDRISARGLTELSTGWGKLETGTAIAPSSFTPSQQYIYVEDLYGLSKIGEDELMDTDVALDQIVGSSFGISINNAIEAAILNGTGHGSSQPEGIITNGTTATIDGSAMTVTPAADTTTGTLVWQDLVKLEFSVVKPQYAQNGSYVVNRSTAKAMRLFVPASGTAFPLWQPSLEAGTPPTYNGYPVYQSAAMPTLPTTTGTKTVALFGDFKSNYQIVERLGLTMLRLNELYAETGLVGFRVHRRIGGAPIRGEAVAALTSAHT